MGLVYFRLAQSLGSHQTDSLRLRPLLLTLRNYFRQRIGYCKRSPRCQGHPVFQKSYTRPVHAAVGKKPVREITAFGPEGLILFGFPPGEVKKIQSWLARTDLKVVSGEEALHRSSSVSHAVRLLSDENFSSNSEQDSFTCFSRVVLFCGLGGEVIEGLIEVWDGKLSNGPISYAFATPNMMQENLETALLKVIQASDENDMSEGWQVDISSKEKLRNLVSGLKRGNGRTSKALRKPKSTEPKGFSKEGPK